MDWQSGQRWQPSAENKLVRIALLCLSRHGGTLLCGRRLASAIAKIKGLNLAYIGSKEASYGSKDDLDSTEIPKLVVSTGSSKLGNVLQTLYLSNYKKILELIASLVPDIVHFAAPHAWNVILGIGLRRFPLICTIHDPSRHLGAQSSLYAGLAAVQVALADRIIVLSQAHRTSLTRYGKPESRLNVIHHGELGSSKPFHPIPHNRQLLFFGRIEQYKGLDILVDAFHIAKQSQPELSLVIAGRGKLSKKIADMNGTRDIKIYNRWLSDEELNQLCLASDLVVLPYIEATQSGVAAKAQALGRPVIVTSVGGLPEQIEDGISGSIVPPNSVNALARAIGALLQDEKRLSEMSRAAWNLYKCRYDWDSIASETVKAYERAREDRLTFGPTRLTAGLRAFLSGALSRR
jgi:glycosyltransferase involved in cell wall biosynthesis